MNTKLRMLFREHDLAVLSKELEKVKQIFIDLNAKNDKRTYFVDKPGGYPAWMYSAAYGWVKRGQLNLKRLVDEQLNLYRRERNLSEIQDSSGI